MADRGSGGDARHAAAVERRLPGEVSHFGGEHAAAAQEHDTRVRKRSALAPAAPVDSLDLDAPSARPILAVGGSLLVAVLVAIGLGGIAWVLPAAVGTVALAWFLLVAVALDHEAKWEGGQPTGTRARAREARLVVFSTVVVGAVFCGLVAGVI